MRQQKVIESWIKVPLCHLSHPLSSYIVGYQVYVHTATRCAHCTYIQWQHTATRCAINTAHAKLHCIVHLTSSATTSWYTRCWYKVNPLWEHSLLITALVCGQRFKLFHCVWHLNVSLPLLCHLRAVLELAQHWFAAYLSCLSDKASTTVPLLHQSPLLFAESALKCIHGIIPSPLYTLCWHTPRHQHWLHKYRIWNTSAYREVQME